MALKIAYAVGAGVVIGAVAAACVLGLAVLAQIGLIENPPPAWALGWAVGHLVPSSVMVYQVAERPDSLRSASPGVERNK